MKEFRLILFPLFEQKNTVNIYTDKPILIFKYTYLDFTKKTFIWRRLVFCFVKNINYIIIYYYIRCISYNMLARILMC